VARACALSEKKRWLKCIIAGEDGSTSRNELFLMVSRN